MRCFSLRVLGTSVAICALIAGSFTVASAESAGTVVGRITCGDDETTPAAHIVVQAEGLHLRTVTDESGHFMLSGVPTDVPITVEAIADPQASFIVERSNVTLSAGETLDIGSMDLAVCGQPAAPAGDDGVIDTEH
jgi:carboxypeptidase family protein